MPIYYKGVKLTIERTDDAVASQREAEASVPGNHKACIAQLDALIKRLADIGQLRSPEQFRHEDKQIYAIKARHGLRAYGWYHSSKRGVFVISHYILKKWNKMKAADRERALKNKTEYEELNNE